VFIGLPGSPSLARSLTLSGKPAALAVSDDGAAVLAAYGDSVYAAGISAEWRALPGTASNSAVAFAPGTRDAVIAARDSGVVSLVRGVSESAETTTLAGPGDAISAPTGVAFAADGRVLVANAGNRSLAILDPAGSNKTTVLCACSPTGIAAMGPVFRLNELADAPLWLVDVRSGDPRLVFIPAPPPSTNAANGDANQ